MSIKLFFFFFGAAGYIIAQRKVPQFIIPDLTGFEVTKLT